MPHFVNTVNLMNRLLSPKNSTWFAVKDDQTSQFFEKAVYVKDDDQDWGSAGMNNIQKDPE